MNMKKKKSYRKSIITSALLVIVFLIEGNAAILAVIGTSSPETQIEINGIDSNYDFYYDFYRNFLIEEANFTDELIDNEINQYIVSIAKTFSLRSQYTDISYDKWSVWTQKNWIPIVFYTILKDNPNSYDENFNPNDPEYIEIVSEIKSFFDYQINFEEYSNLLQGHFNTVTLYDIEVLSHSDASYQVKVSYTYEYFDHSIHIYCKKIAAIDIHAGSYDFVHFDSEDLDVGGAWESGFGTHTFTLFTNLDYSRTNWGIVENNFWASLDVYANYKTGLSQKYEHSGQGYWDIVDDYPNDPVLDKFEIFTYDPGNSGTVATSSKFFAIQENPSIKRYYIRTTWDQYMYNCKIFYCYNTRSDPNTFTTWTQLNSGLVNSGNGNNRYVTPIDFRSIGIDYDEISDILFKIEGTDNDGPNGPEPTNLFTQRQSTTISPNKLGNLDAEYGFHWRDIPLIDLECKYYFRPENGGLDDGYWIPEQYHRIYAIKNGLNTFVEPIEFKIIVKNGNPNTVVLKGYDLSIGAYSILSETFSSPISLDRFDAINISLDLDSASDSIRQRWFDLVNTGYIDLDESRSIICNIDVRYSTLESSSDISISYSNYLFFGPPEVPIVEYLCKDGQLISHLSHPILDLNSNGEYMREKVSMYYKTEGDTNLAYGSIFIINTCRLPMTIGEYSQGTFSNPTINFETEKYTPTGEDDTRFYGFYTSRKGIQKENESPYGNYVVGVENKIFPVGDRLEVYFWDIKTAKWETCYEESTSSEHSKLSIINLNARGDSERDPEDKPFENTYSFGDYAIVPIVIGEKHADAYYLGGDDMDFMEFFGVFKDPVRSLLKFITNFKNNMKNLKTAFVNAKSKLETTLNWHKSRNINPTTVANTEALLEAVDDLDETRKKMEQRTNRINGIFNVISGGVDIYQLLEFEKEIDPINSYKLSFGNDRLPYRIQFDYQGHSYFYEKDCIHDEATINIDTIISEKQMDNINTHLTLQGLRGLFNIISGAAYIFGQPAIGKALEYVNHGLSIYQWFLIRQINKENRIVPDDSWIDIWKAIVNDEEVPVPVPSTSTLNPYKTSSNIIDEYFSNSELEDLEEIDQQVVEFIKNYENIVINQQNQEIILDNLDYAYYANNEQDFNTYKQLLIQNIEAKLSFADGYSSSLSSLSSWSSTTFTSMTGSDYLSSINRQDLENALNQAATNDENVNVEESLRTYDQLVNHGESFSDYCGNLQRNGEYMREAFENTAEMKKDQLETLSYMFDYNNGDFDPGILPSEPIYAFYWLGDIYTNIFAYTAHIQSMVNEVEEMINQEIYDESIDNKVSSIERQTYYLLYYLDISFFDIPEYYTLSERDKVLYYPENWLYEQIVGPMNTALEYKQIAIAFRDPEFSEISSSHSNYFEPYQTDYCNFLMKSKSPENASFYVSLKDEDQLLTQNIIVNYPTEIYLRAWSSSNMHFNITDNNKDLLIPKSITFTLTSSLSDKSYDITYEYNLIDDDITAPIINIEYTGDKTDENPGWIEIDIYDLESGIDEIIVKLNGKLVNATDGLYLLPNTPGTYNFEIFASNNDTEEGGVFDQESSIVYYQVIIEDDDTIAPELSWEYFGDYTDENPGYIVVYASDNSTLSVDPSGIYYLSSDLGEQSFTFVAIDADEDRPGDQLNITEIVSILIHDDDTIAPELSWEYFGDYTDGNPGYIVVYASDNNALSVDPSGIYYLSSDLGEQSFTFVAIDADEDRPGDQLNITEIVSILIHDDDTIAPELSWEYFGDYTDGNPGYIVVYASDNSALSVDPSGIYYLSSNLGEQSFTFVAIDADEDRPGDQLNITEIVSILIHDDDTIAPELSWEYFGDYTDGNPGYIVVYASDNSALSVDPSGIYYLSSNLGEQSFTFVAIDADEDRPGDQLNITETVSIVIIDDDTEKPLLSNITITCDFQHVNISLQASGFETMKILVNGQEITPLSITQDGDTYNITLKNQWISELGTFEVEIWATDDDNDRPDDALSASISGTFDIDIQMMYDFIDYQIEELKVFVVDNIEDFKTQKKLLKKLERLRKEVFSGHIDKANKKIDKLEYLILNNGDLTEDEMEFMIDALTQIRDIINIPIDLIDELLVFVVDNIEDRKTQKKLLKTLEHLKKKVLKGHINKANNIIDNLEYLILNNGDLTEDEMEFMIDALTQIRDIINTPIDLIDELLVFVADNIEDCKTQKKLLKTLEQLRKKVLKGHIDKLNKNVDKLEHYINKAFTRFGITTDVMEFMIDALRRIFK